MDTPDDIYVRQCPPPITTFLPDEVFKPGAVALPELKKQLYGEGKLLDSQVFWLIDQVLEIFCSEENIVVLDSPATVCGDIHGQFYDLLKILELGGNPENTNYLFLGDYVDRGMFSMEVVLYLFAHKINYPDSFFMLRGNHECRHLTNHFSFKTECERKYGLEIYDAIMDVFDALPLAAVLNGQFLCVHGGISPNTRTLDDIWKINRFCEPPSHGAMCDLLWADPNPDFDCPEEFLVNTSRGCSYYYSHAAVLNFLEENELLSIIRAHEAQDSGFSLMKASARSNFPSVITLFSAPNYLGTYDNKGAIFKYNNNAIDIKQFLQSPAPFVLPGWENAITWSIQFLVEKVTEIMGFFTQPNLESDESEEDAMEIERKATQQAERANATRTKILAIAQMLRMLKIIRDQKGLQHKGPRLHPGISSSDPLPRTIKEVVILEKRPSMDGLTIHHEAKVPTEEARKRKQEVEGSFSKLESSRAQRLAANPELASPGKKGKPIPGLYAATI